MQCSEKPDSKFSHAYIKKNYFTSLAHNKSTSTVRKYQYHILSQGPYPYDHNYVNGDIRYQDEIQIKIIFRTISAVLDS